MSDREPAPGPDPLLEALVWPSRLALLGLVLVTAAVAWWTLSSLQGVLVPLVGSLLVAYLLDPLVDALEARGQTRTRAIGSLVVAALLVTVLFAVFLVPTIRAVVLRFLDGLPSLLDQLERSALPWLASWMGDAAPTDVETLLRSASDQLQAALPALAERAASSAGAAWSSMSAVSATLANLVLVPFFTFYFLRDFDVLRGQALTLVPPRHRARVADGATRADLVVGAWFRGQVHVASLLGGLYALGLGVTFGMTELGVTAGVAVGVLAGALNFIPYVGTTVGVGLALGLLLLDGASWLALGLAVLTFVVVQTLEGYVITPRIVGDNIGLSTMAVLVALLIGGELFGLVGLLLALPAAGIVKAFVPDLLDAYRRSRWFEGDEQELDLDG